MIPWALGLSCTVRHYALWTFLSLSQFFFFWLCMRPMLIMNPCVFCSPHAFLFLFISYFFELAIHEVEVGVR